MIRFITKEVYVGHVVHAGGQPETRIVSFTEQDDLESFLRYDHEPGGKKPDYLTRELLGIEIIDE